MLRKLAALVLGPALLVGALGAARAAAAGDEHAGSFVAKANSERASRGLPAYAVKSDLAAVAARHSARMASSGRLYHNPNLGSEVDGWQVVGENVGTGGSVDSIHRALMDSPSHRANILARDYTEVGVGTVTDAKGVMWVTQVFRKPMQAPAVMPRESREVARTVVRVPIQRRPYVRPAAQPAPVAPPRRPVAPRVADAVSATALAGALAPAAPAAPGDPFALAVSYATTLTALSR